MRSEVCASVCECASQKVRGREEKVNPSDFMSTFASFHLKISDIASHRIFFTIRSKIEIIPIFLEGLDPSLASFRCRTLLRKSEKRCSGDSFGKCRTPSRNKTPEIDADEHLKPFESINVKRIETQVLFQRTMTVFLF